MCRLVFVIVALAAATGCVADDPPALQSEQSAPEVTSDTLPTCPAGGPDATTPAAGCLGPDGDVQRDDGSDASRTVTPVEFAEAIEESDSFLVNVHVPYEGEIDSTDAFVPFDEIGGDERLPPDRDRPILLYCESGRMSAVAAEALVRDGYTDVIDLAGGMEAWRNSGFPIEGDEG